MGVPTAWCEVCLICGPHNAEVSMHWLSNSIKNELAAILKPEGRSSVNGRLTVADRGRCTAAGLCGHHPAVVPPPAVDDVTAVNEDAIAFRYSAHVPTLPPSGVLHVLARRSPPEFLGRRRWQAATINRVCRLGELTYRPAIPHF